MRTTKLSIFLYGAGIIATIFVIVQWYIKFPDLSQLIFGLNLAITILAFAYLHSWMRFKDESITELNRALDAVLDYSRTEIEKIKKAEELEL